MADEPKPAVRTNEVVLAALESGAINRDLRIADVAERLRGRIDEVAGYVAAWDRYVLVVAREDITPEITFKRS